MAGAATGPGRALVYRAVSLSYLIGKIVSKSPSRLAFFATIGPLDVAVMYARCSRRVSKQRTSMAIRG